MCRPHVRGLRVECETCLVSPISQFLQSFFTSVWIHASLFYTLSYGAVPLSLFCWSDCSSLGRWELVQVVPEFS